MFENIVLTKLIVRWLFYILNTDFLSLLVSRIIISHMYSMAQSQFGTVSLTKKYCIVIEIQHTGILYIRYKMKEFQG